MSIFIPSRDSQALINLNDIKLFQRHYRAKDHIFYGFANSQKIEVHESTIRSTCVKLLPSSSLSIVSLIDYNGKIEVSEEVILSIGMNALGDLMYFVTGERSGIVFSGNEAVKNTITGIITDCGKTFKTSEEWRNYKLEDNYDHGYN